MQQRANIFFSIKTHPATFAEMVHSPENPALSRAATKKKYIYKNEQKFRNVLVAFESN